MIECNHCFQFEFDGGPLRCNKCDQIALVFPVPASKLRNPVKSAEAGEWNASYMWHKMPSDEQKRGLVTYFESVLKKLKEHRSAMDIAYVQRTVEACKREPRREPAAKPTKQGGDLEAILNDLELIL